MRERIENTADNGSQAVNPQPTDHILLGGWAADNFPSAINMPIDSINTISMTIVRVIIEAGSKVGQPKAKGRTMANQAASFRPEKLTSPISSATTKPKPIPNNTEILEIKPLLNRVISKIKISTSNETPI